MNDMKHNNTQALDVDDLDQVSGGMRLYGARMVNGSESDLPNESCGVEMRDNSIPNVGIVVLKDNTYGCFR